MQHVGVTSASEVHKYPADIGKYIVSFITDAWVLAIVFPCHTLKVHFPRKNFFFIFFFCKSDLSMRYKALFHNYNHK